MLDSASLPAGALVAGRYRIDGALGAGGMSWVFRAVDTHLDRPVALKVLRDQAVMHADRLGREARAAARLQHPAVVGIHDLGQLADGRPFIVQEYIEGQTLTEVLKAGPLAPARAVHLLAPVAGALGEAHRRGIVHRDLKPDNLMLEAQPGQAARLRLLDFGIAAIELEGETRFTQDGAVFGTPEYMAPEQALGKRATPATDVWALGILLHTVLAGRPPFTGKHIPEILFKITQRDPERLPGELPAALVRLVADCLKKTPEDRPTDGTAFLARLNAWSAPATGIGPPPRPKRAWLAATAGGGLVAGVLVGLLMAPGRRAPAPEVAVAAVTEGGPPSAAGGSLIAASLIAAPPSAALPAAPPTVAVGLGEAEALLPGEPAAALVWLDAHPQAGRPAMRLVLRGLAHLATKEVAAGLTDLTAALVGDAADPELAHDRRVLPALIAVLDHRDADAAVPLLGGPLAPLAGPELLRVAGEGGVRARWRAVDALERAGVDAQPARLAALRRDLRVGDCDRRKRAARLLGELGDPAALPDLRRANNRGLLDNYCMSDTIDVAIRALKAP